MVGDDPPESCVAEVFEVPSERWDVEAAGERGFMPRGLDVDTNGVLWTALSGTNHLASFDRSQCGSLTGPEAHTGRHCAEGWTLHPLPGPTFKGTDVRADYNYYNSVVRLILSTETCPASLGKSLPCPRSMVALTA